MKRLVLARIGMALLSGENALEIPLCVLTSFLQRTKTWIQGLGPSAFGETCSLLALLDRWCTQKQCNACAGQPRPRLDSGNRAPAVSVKPYVISRRVESLSYWF